MTLKLILLSDVEREDKQIHTMSDKLNQLRSRHPTARIKLKSPNYRGLHLKVVMRIIMQHMVVTATMSRCGIMLSRNNSNSSNKEGRGKVSSPDRREPRERRSLENPRW